MSENRPSLAQDNDLPQESITTDDHLQPPTDGLTDDGLSDGGLTDGGTIIRTHNLTKKFGEETAVDAVTIEIPRGKIFGFIGPSGCGKTTTVRMMIGIYQPTAGEVTVFNQQPLNFNRQQKEKIGYMPQLFVLYPALTVWENLNFAASLYGVPWRRHKRLQDLLSLVELEGHESKLVRNISGGMQRRLSLAAALVHNPELLFLDEPTTGIDPVLRRKFWDYFKELQAEGRTLFITTQYVGEAAYCDYIGVMDKGQLLMVETPEGLRRRATGGDMSDLKLTRRLTYEERNQLEAEPFVREVLVEGENTYRVVVEDASVDIPRLITWCGERDLEIELVREYLLPFDDVFVKLIEREGVNHVE
ncbi:MAG: ABC transporter ATP-binding protein [Chloroflexota bacterium]|jgi:ABC-2 type transport system ATP-binding protein